MNDQTPDSASHGTSYSALTFSFLAGGLAGATVALLLAPQSGKVTREIMGRKLNEAADSTRELKGRMKDKLNHVADSARDLKDRAVRRGQEVREEAAYRVEGAASALAGKDGQ
jgi:gas vesicle protein